MAKNRLELLKRLDEAKAAAQALRESALVQKRAEIEERRAALTLRTENMEADAPDEDRIKLEEETAAFIADDDELTAQEAAEKAELDRLDGEIAEIESDIAAIDERAQRAAHQGKTPNEPLNTKITPKERKQTL